MLDIIKMILDILSKFINPSEISRVHKEKRVRDLGAELFLLYVNLNEILLSAEQIIERLERYLKYVDDWMAHGHIAYAMSASWAHNRKVELDQQLQNIIKLSGNLNRFGPQLQILNADAYSKLQKSFVSKTNILQNLIGLLRHMLHEKCLPVLPSNKLESLLHPIQEGNFEIVPTWQQLFEESVSFSDTSAWGPNTYKKIESFLNSGKPRQQLDDIRAALQQLHSTLRENFSIQDILLEVGDRRLSSSR